jgi:molybdopterin-containing oxidoreductase family iron-sulfur binding subunit
MTRKTDNPKAARYAMVIDVDRCNGCGACMLACAVENNVAPAPRGVNDRTGVTPIRVYRLEANGRAAFLPVMCQHCEKETPCVAVCPQNAVEFDPMTGIVSQIPARCLGCRYCMAACPYHARYFNWWDPQWPAGMEATLNPGVSPRMRGVVEKCNLCHARWHDARQAAAANGEAGPVSYTPACAEACPTRAIAFGDLNNGFATSGAFRMLESIDTGARVYYRS